MNVQITAGKAQLVEDEDVLTGTCQFGGSWRLRSNGVAPLPGRWYDRLDMACDRRRQSKSFVFDIRAFFISRPGVWMVAHRSA